MFSALYNRISHSIKSARAAVSLSSALYVLLYLPWLLLLGWMAGLSWWLTDDAFISFRYARNLLDGHGLVFNPGERVEGYTNFLWTLELAGIWGLFGIRPEDSAPWLSVLFTAGALAAVIYQVSKMPSLRHRRLVSWMAMGLLCGSATFAVWTSAGGLETRQFTFFVVAAVVLLAVHRNSRAGLLCASASLGLASLTRPEGLLIAGCCIGWFVLERMAGAHMPDVRGAEQRWSTRFQTILVQMLKRVDWRDVACLMLPFALMIGAHFLFRWSYYGDLLPNTYYAKFVRPWWDMGLRYYTAASLETGLYLLVPLAAAGFWIRWRRHRDGIYALVLLCVGLHAVYVMRLGGDHFEWRPLDFYWPLLAVPAAEGIAWLGAKLASSVKRIAPALSRLSRPAPVFFALCVFAPVLFYSSAMQFALVVRLADTGKLSPYSTIELERRDAPWLFAVPGMGLLYQINEDMRAKMARHLIGWKFLKNRQGVSARKREFASYEGALQGKMPEDAATVLLALGVIGYSLAEMTAVDYYGLADKTIARHPQVPPNEKREIAHDRAPPYGYLDRRGVNMRIWPAARSEEEALATAGYALQLGEKLWMPFDAIDHRWIQDSFDGLGLASVHDGASAIDVMNDLAGSSEPVIRSGYYDVHIIADGVVYVKSPCIWDDVQHDLYVYLTPADGSYLSTEGQLYGFDELSFHFWDRDVAADPDACIAKLDLPDYKVASIRTMQLTGNQGVVWDGSYSVHTVGAVDALRELRRQGREPDISSDYDVFLDSDRLIYYKPSCSADEIDARFFLHVHPADVNDLPQERREPDFDNLDFSLWQNGGRVENECVAKADLPGYEIAEVRTGQLTRDGHEAWSAAYSFMASETIGALAESWRKGVEPAIASDYDVFVDGGRLIYHKPSCSADETNARFLLHVYPTDVNDLPQGRREYGFENLNFNLRQNGGRVGNECVAKVDLPDYEIVEIRTGQFVSDIRIWQGSIDVGRD